MKLGSNNADHDMGDSAATKASENNEHYSTGIMAEVHEQMNKYAEEAVHNYEKCMRCFKINIPVFIGLLVALLTYRCSTLIAILMAISFGFQVYFYYLGFHENRASHILRQATRVLQEKKLCKEQIFMWTEAH